MQESRPQSTELEVLTYDQLSLKLQIPRRTLERLVSKSQIPSRKVGRAVRFYWPHIVDWLEDKRRRRR